MARYDLELVRSAASGRWVEILSALGGVSADLLDGRHHGCPKHCHPDAGGKDRFRLLDASAGACVCNQCFNSKNGDGFAAVAWLTDQDFAKSLEAVAKYLGIKPEKKKKANPAEHLEWMHWNETTVGLWCESKPPITPGAVRQAGGRLAKYRNEYTVVAIPVWGPAFDLEDPVGWALYRADGGMLPHYKKKGEPPEWKKILLAPGSEKGVIGDPKQCSALVAKPDTSQTTDPSQQELGAIAADTSSITWWKLEGPSDLLTALSQSFPNDHRFFTTANGAMEIPLDWIVELMADRTVYVCHDCDLPGQRGATWVEQRDGQRRPGWGPRLAERAKEVRNVVLPFVIEPNHGSDLRDFFKNGGTVQSLLERAEDAEHIEAKHLTAKELAPRAEDDPDRLADVNLQRYRATGRDLRFWNDEWYQYKGTSYTRLGIKKLRPRVWKAIQSEFEQWWTDHKDAQEKPVSKVTNRLVTDVVSAMESKCYTRTEQRINTWIDDDGPEDCIAMRNGVLCLSELFKSADDRDDTKILLPHSPKWFSSVCLPYDFDPKASCPTWENFLDSSFNGDQESIDTLQMWFGLMLTPITRYQKMLFVIGPTRSGKGTIQRTLINMLGRETVASPSVNDLAGQFVLHGLLDKTVVVISDARLSSRADGVAITERLLSITGEDPQDVQRKYIDTLHGVKLQVRFTLFSNVLPKLSDTSAAFISRGLFLAMPNSYLGREDLRLSEKIQSELPGVLNWAICGRFRLMQQERFIQPKSGQKLVDEMRLAISPVAAFIQEYCDTSDPDGTVDTKDLFEAFCDWARENDQVHKLDQSAFGKRIRDVIPNVEKRKLSFGGSRANHYVGIQLKPEFSRSFV